MAVTRTATGTFDNTFNGTSTPPSISSVAGETWIIATGIIIGTATISTPSGWTDLSDNTNCGQTRIFALPLVGGDTIPGFSWGNVWAWSILFRYSGLDSGLSTGFAPIGRQTNQTTNIVWTTVNRTPTVDNSLVLYVGNKNKTSASDSSTFTAPTNFTMTKSQVIAGTRSAVCVAEFIQTTATQINANMLFSGSVADASVQSAQGVSVSLAPSLVTPLPCSMGIFVNP